MPLPRQLREEMQARNAAAAVEADRDRRRDLLRTAMQCVFWCGLGIFLLLWSFHTTSETYGRVAFLGGLAIGNGGWLFTVLAAYRRGERRGDW
jgi:hypothetical protein